MAGQLQLALMEGVAGQLQLALMEGVAGQLQPLLCLDELFDLQGNRFGGALDGAAQQFSAAYDKGMLPGEFVNEMRRKHELIMGIGHRVKSVSYEDVICIGALQTDWSMFHLLGFNYIKPPP